jgi:hypothetical protein
VSLVTVSANGRVYHRHFDHDEARRLRAQGWSWSKLAERFGVTTQAVTRVCDPEVAARMSASYLESQRRQRMPCRGGCGRLVWQIGNRSGYCTRCVAAQRTAGDVRPAELRCIVCRQWKPDDEFGTSHGRLSRRGHDSDCRACASARRRDYRRRHPEKAAAENRRHVERLRRKRMSRYIVFQPNGDGFVEVARVDAGSPAHAIEQAATAPGDYVAVTEGRFKLMRVAPVEAFRVVAGEEKAGQ